MIRTDLLRATMTERGISQAQMAVRLGISTRTFYKRMKAGVFRSDEMEAMAELLELHDLAAVFFGGCRAASKTGDGEQGRDGAV